MALTHTMQNLFTDAIFAKNIPRDIRGLMLGVHQIVGSIGVMVFTFVGAKLHDNYGP